MQATVNMRRVPKSDEWLCKDKDQCKQRRIALRANRIAGTKGKK